MTQYEVGTVRTDVPSRLPPWARRQPAVGPAGVMAAGGLAQLGVEAERKPGEEIRPA